MNCNELCSVTPLSHPIERNRARCAGRARLSLRRCSRGSRESRSALCRRSQRSQRSARSGALEWGPGPCPSEDRARRERRRWSSWTSTGWEKAAPSPAGRELQSAAWCLGRCCSHCGMLPSSPKIFGACGCLESPTTTCAPPRRAARRQEHERRPGPGPQRALQRSVVAPPALEVSTPGSCCCGGAAAGRPCARTATGEAKGARGRHQRRRRPSPASHRQHLKRPALGWIARRRAEQQLPSRSSSQRPAATKWAAINQDVEQPSTSQRSAGAELGRARTRLRRGARGTSFAPCLASSWAGSPCPAH
jgi:hypothetical protein